MHSTMNMTALSSNSCQFILIKGDDSNAIALHYHWSDMQDMEFKPKSCKQASLDQATLVN